MKIMLVEDDEVIATSIKNELQKYKYDTVIVDDFNEVLDFFTKEEPNIVLMDLVLPIHNGYYWCQEIRKISNIPIIFLSSRSENMDIVMGMQLGGDDYITKPFDMTVLVAKIQAVLRRTYDFSTKISVLEFKGLKFDIKNMFLDFSGEKIEITKIESQILTGLFNEKGAFISREKLIELCWKSNDFISDGTLAVNINRLRKKLEAIGSDVLIETKKGYGYALRSHDGS